MQVIGERVLVRHVLRPPQTKGGIFIPEYARGQSHEGVVLGVGSRIKHPEIKEGDRVLFEKRKGQIVQLAGANLRMLHYDDVLGKVRTGRVALCPKCKGMGSVVDIEPVVK